MSTDGSITHWLSKLQEGDREAAQPLWERYFHLLVSRALGSLEHPKTSGG